ncbi:MAG TPA: bifunctional diaminohydroxyphosphoribosylaminopyrimidine deaminase/5-amino-6-(5-phosphoribosylamino)uracil reductase RibD [Steroidobacteraceae bacterium]|nr:bifunctional diaminohydroxyphosphoribosylaminopyrimidine deaminase/5-amino-6-(5-phosphoribosylamino)uracil reductase RibD [Steroidobacteraceae bacterium]
MSASPALDAGHMARALELARRGLDTTDPNPRVGCVVARDDRVLGEGWHQRAGGPHAEVFALEAAGAAARDATAYVTLEPCSHQGRTPPCADALVAAGIGRVVYAMRDPNPKVHGGGIARLAAAGIEVEGGVLEREALELNPGFVSRMTRGRPWVSVKLAASLDGATALPGGESQWITGEAAREDVQRLRARSSAVMTGSGTVIADDPRLDVRLPGTVRQPLRVVLDSRLRTPASARILAPPGQVLILCSDEDPARTAPLLAAGAEVMAVGSSAGGVDLEAALTALAARQVNELLVECGAGLAGALLAAGLADELLLYLAPTLLGRGSRPLADLEAPATLAERLRFSIVERQDVGDDLLLRLRPRH